MARAQRCTKANRFEAELKILTFSNLSVFSVMLHQSLPSCSIEWFAAVCCLKMQITAGDSGNLATTRKSAADFEGKSLTHSWTESPPLRNAAMVGNYLRNPSAIKVSQRPKLAKPSLDLGLNQRSQSLKTERFHIETRHHTPPNHRTP
jgi:hypothetical protein